MPDRSAPTPAVTPAEAATKPRPTGPGRPKDLGKRAAILETAKRLFTTLGFTGVSMDQIAAEAGVSKLTVYSHFGDKEALFAAAVQAHCEQQLPDSLFAAADAAPLREGLLQIARAFFGMICGPEALAGHRTLCTPQVLDTPMPRLFWEAGPQRIQDAVAVVLQHHVATGELAIDDVARAASQFLCLAKGELHAQLVFGCCTEVRAHEVEAQLEAAVDLFLRGYGTGR
ncbi:transcriptional regulator [Lysobacter helvus]|uniref:Transcriptional regulator n=2 Tax=Lysobacteraceae TaxID=32033 RepID=A0ABM7Q5N9_9GAMM|nr:MULTISPECIES: TetR/AcrR family transcriptional regulator [Lysobacter]BCT92652.1 transcriptional regulator [Lysobacter caseinilyticus]BCT95805.1 transcriptional regulator [Lysobacter helvus]